MILKLWDESHRPSNLMILYLPSHYTLGGHTIATSLTVAQYSRSQQRREVGMVFGSSLKKSWGEDTLILNLQTNTLILKWKELGSLVCNLHVCIVYQGTSSILHSSCTHISIE